MKTCVQIALLAALAGCQPALDGREVAAMTESAGGDPARGLDVADRNCSLCHAIAAEGASPHPKAPAFRTLSSRYPLDALAEALAEGIVVGHSGMPQIQLEPQKIDDLIAYLETIQTPSGRPR
jgi:mono/diheme cytochrome c family protein